MSVELLNVEPVTPKIAPMTKPVFTPEPKKNALTETLEAMLPVFATLAAVLAVRLFLLFAIIGAFILAQTSLSDSSDKSIWVLIAYCAFTILPLVWLDTHGKRRE